QPLHVRDDEDWRRLTRTTDGIVLDDLDFRKWSPATYLKLLDIAKPVTQNIKYGSVRVPAGTPRFLIVNSMDMLWPARMHPATKMACERALHPQRLGLQQLCCSRRPVTQESWPTGDPLPFRPPSRLFHRILAKRFATTVDLTRYSEGSRNWTGPWRIPPSWTRTSSPEESGGKASM
ncbi:hypothetical protein Trydic_g15350, partial [Trypoxylus dichotomus]